MTRNPAPPDDGDYAPGYAGARAWLLLVFLGLLNILNFVDRQLLQSFVVDVRRDLDISYFQFSLLTGLFFSISYTVAGVFMGALADRLPRPRLIAGGLVAWSALTAASGAAANFAQLAGARAFVALGEASLSPSALSMIADVFPAQRRGLASGAYYLGIPIGAGGSLIVAGVLGPLIGWRGCFYALGAFGVLAALFVLILNDPPRRSRKEGTPPPLHRALPDLGAAFRQSPGLLFLAVGATFAIFSQGALVLDQAWLVEERGFEVSAAQKIFGALFLLAGSLGALIGGQLSDWFHARFRGGRLLFLAAAFAVIGPVGIAYRFLPTGGVLFYTAAAIGALSLMLPFGPIVSAAAELAPARARATVIAAVVLAMALFGTAFGNAFAGWLADVLAEASVNAPLTWALTLCGATNMLAIPFFIAAARRYPSDGAAAP